MSVKEMEAMTVGFEETMDFDIISQSPQFIDYCVRQLDELGVPMITPAVALVHTLTLVRSWITFPLSGILLVRS